MKSLICEISGSYNRGDTPLLFNGMFQRCLYKKEHFLKEHFWNVLQCLSTRQTLSLISTDMVLVYKDPIRFCFHSQTKYCF